jgi:16S rRNA (guanine966-N2)-methyltransferase
MGDRERGAIFNALKHDLENATVLDAFAGSGAVGLEALSRGAKSVTFLENDKKALRTIAENIAKLDVVKQATFAKSATGINGKFGIIVADPPYDKSQYALITKLLGHLKPDGIFVLSHSKTTPPPTFSNLTLLSDKTYASANIKIYKNFQ